MIVELTDKTTLRDMHRADFIYQRLERPQGNLQFRVVKNRNGRGAENITFDSLKATFKALGEEPIKLNRYPAPIAINKSPQRCKPVVVSL